MSSDAKIFEVLDEYFKKLDTTPISPTGIFSSESDKERYETLFMYAFRKYRAAIYHYENVKAFIKADEANVQKTLIPELEKSQASKMVMRISRTADHYAYELSAFLEALKSSVDFLAAACTPHLPDIKFDSIKTLTRLVKKGRTGPIFDEVKRNLEWLERLRSYRHHVVHRRIISTSSGYERRVIEGIAKTAIHPVIIPESPPPYIPDTRRRRAMEESLGFDSLWKEVRVKMVNGREKILNYSFSYHPPAGFTAIENFMESHLNSFEKFFTEIVHTLSGLNFRTCTDVR
jgi:hypothetical protein